MLESEAIKKICPVMSRNIEHPIYCQVTDCMLWSKHLQYKAGVEHAPGTWVPVSPAAGNCEMIRQD